MGLAALLMNSGPVAPPQGLTLFTTDGKTGNSATTHTMTGLPAGSLIVLSTGMSLGGGIIPIIANNAGLTFTKRADGDGASGSAEIYTTRFTAGGDVNIISDWGSGRYQSSFIRVYLNAEVTFGGATGSAVQQVQPLVNITSTRAASILVAISSDWNAETGTITYRGDATQDYLSHDPSAASIYHYSYNAPLTIEYSVGMTSPSEFDGKSTAVIEIRPTAAPDVDLTPPSAPALSLTGTSSSSVSISWTASFDNVGVTGYEVYLDNVLVTTKTTLTHSFTGLSPDTTYEAFVRAKDAAGNGTNSNTVSGFTGTGGGGSLSPFTMTEIPYSDPDIITYGRGAEQWHSPCTNSSGCPTSSFLYDRISNPSVASNNQWVENSLNLYFRVQWTQLEDSTQDSYKFISDTNNILNTRIRSAIENKQMVSFGIMTFYDDPPDSDVTYDNGQSSYPLYVHNLMQGESVKDWKTTGSGVTTGSGRWVPNWNSTNYINRLKALHTAIKTHLLNTSHLGVTFADAVYCIDIRGYGNYGEWHTGGICDWDNYPAGTQPTIATFKAIIDAHTDVFDQWPLVMMVAGYNAYDDSLSFEDNGSPIPLFHPYAEVAHYALDATNAWGQVGFRRDQVISEEEYLTKLLADNGSQFPVGVGLTVAEKFTNLYKTAPGTGEPLPGGFDGFGANNLDATIQLYHHTSFGNGNYGGGGRSSTHNTSAAGDRVRGGFKRCGFRLKITSGEAPLTILKGVSFSIKTNWVNVGIAPTYEDWQVRFELQDGAGVAIWTGISSKVLKLFTPDDGTVLTTDNFTVPSSAATGTYKLVVKVIDPKGYKNNLLLAMQPINADSSYTIFESVQVNSNV